MGRINISRWLAGGLAAAIVLLVVDIAAFPLYQADYEVAFATHALAPMTGRSMVFSFGQIALSGFVLVFLYAAMRPRFGPGARTAVIAAITLWIARWVSVSLYYHAVGLFPDRMLAVWLVIGLASLTIASLVGGWIYREATG